MEESKSLLYKFEPITRRWPAITKPEGHVHFRTKLLWTFGALIAYFVLSNVLIFGLAGSSIDVFSQFRAILAGASGSLVHLGIGPIVTGSIIMQLFSGAKIINLDLTREDDKRVYQGFQKIMVVLMIFVESIPQVFGFLTPSEGLANTLAPYGAAHSIIVSAVLLMVFAALAVTLSGQRDAGTAGIALGNGIGGVGALLAFLVGGMAFAQYVPGGVWVAVLVGLLFAAAGAGLMFARRDPETAGPAQQGATGLVGVVVGILLAAGLLAIGKADWSFGGHGAAAFWIVMQLALGSWLVFLMDEMVSKWGLGSGISLFIAAGVSQSLFTGLINWIPEQGLGSGYSAFNPPAGLIPKTVYLLTVFSSQDLVHAGGFERILLSGPNSIIALVATLITFFVVVYAESSRIELPLAHGRVRGARGRYPIRLLYASVIPVILASALLANVNLLGLLLWSGPMQNLPLLGGEWLRTHAPDWAGAVGGYQPGQTVPVTGFAYYFSMVNGVQDWLLPFLGANPQLSAIRAPWQIALHVLVYATFMIGGSILFAIFWIETTNMGPSAVAKQIERSGMQIPGFRRDPRVTGKILERYIPVVTVIGGAAIGGLAVFADLLGTIGQATGTGVLLCVGVLQRMYEQMAKEQAMEMHPVLRGFFGEG